MKKILTGLTLALLPFMPMVAAAQTTTTGSATTTAGTLLTTIGNLLNQVIPILFLAALAYFLYTLVRYVGAKDADAQSEARRSMVNAIIVLFVMASVWGLVGFLQNSTGIFGGGSLTGDLTPGVELTTT